MSKFESPRLTHLANCNWISKDSRHLMARRARQIRTYRVKIVGVAVLDAVADRKEETRGATARESATCYRDRLPLEMLTSLTPAACPWHFQELHSSIPCIIGSSKPAAPGMNHSRMLRDDRDY
ncbi:hypothetical protein KM043_003471 [Ampulex compressa]|nr:hypothetical protein KM043_003471 [Ampulex compressa]